MEEMRRYNRSLFHQTQVRDDGDLAGVHAVD